ncbi:hypothetical protein C8F04DRAFT_1192986 [Mycena alexandri]|uniref:Uncharacterized protein n=1 Tax=Mycena alexandri TaxID=1745969 RepID=A0AAD6SEE5_9AGAR|nr:hypothetical protein C8F04DRAFT_1192986 [Mycena alexandri]
MNYTPPSTPAPARPPVNSSLEAEFSVGIFDGLFETPIAISTPGTPAARKTCAIFQAWPRPVTQEDRLLVAFRCMQRAGFETIGDYFAAVLADGNNKHPSVYQSVMAFLQCRGVDVQTHPLSIIERIYQDPRARKRSTADAELHFDLPGYVLPPSQRLLSEPPKVQKNNTHNALINWALHVTVARFSTLEGRG